MIAWWMIHLLTSRSRNGPTENGDKSKGEKQNDAKSFPDDLFDENEVQRTPPTKEGVRAKVEELIKGMVLLKVEDEGAWITMLEWTDVDTLGE